MDAIGQLTAGLDHEIRNPLGLIITYNYVVESYMVDEVSKHANTVIGDCVDRINNLISNLLNFSRLSDDTKGDVNVEQIIRGILTLENKRIERLAINVSLHFEKEIRIKSSEELLKIVMFNLINNAIEAMERNQPFKERNLNIEVFRQSPDIIITIDDSGIGICEDNIDNLFNPFYTTKETGTGLGLYIVNMELSRIGGIISVESCIDEGTTFHITIPESVNE